MSAYVVDNETIHALVKGALEYGYEGEKSADELGQWLLEQNYASVNYRYNEHEQARKYVYEDVEIDEGIVYGCIENYEYQTCELPDYDTSEVWWFLYGLRKALLKRLVHATGLKAYWGYPNDIEYATEMF